MPRHADHVLAAAIVAVRNSLLPVAPPVEDPRGNGQ
jgi:hypothetical protein